MTKIKLLFGLFILRKVVIESNQSERYELLNTN